VGAGKSLGFTQPPTMRVPKKTNEDLRTGKLKAYVAGVLNYDDSLGRSHAFCFLYELHYRNILRDPIPLPHPFGHCE
jgi:hypothetical protein